MCFSYINNIQWLTGSEDIRFVRTAEANSLVSVSNQGVKPVIQPIRAKNIYKSSPF